MMLQEAVPPDMEGAVLDSDSIKQLLTEKFPQQPARDITEAGFSCFECFFYLVGPSLR